jgi:hypothetical protein
MTELSPAAQEVFWAFNKAASGKPDDWHYLPAIAAALQAAADQVVPEHKPWHRTDGEPAARHKVRLELLAIAAELKSQ